jgi:hypothetical protein
MYRKIRVSQTQLTLTATEFLLHLKNKLIFCPSSYIIIPQTFAGFVYDALAGYSTLLTEKLSS